MLVCGILLVGIGWRIGGVWVLVEDGVGVIG